MRQLATIQKIAEVQPIEGADAIVKVRVKDWWCVAKKDEFLVDDLCVYFEIDSLLPVTNPAFEFLAKGTKPKTMVIEEKTYTGYRLKTIRLRGQISQGLALPLRVLKIYSPVLGVNLFNVGEDISEALEIVKYEAPIPAQLTGKVKGTRPSFIPKTDEERIQNIGKLIEQYQGKKFYISEKLDGSSASYYKKDGEFGVCSRNLSLIDTPGNTFWELARKYHLDEILPEGFAVQGEAVGHGIQNNPLCIEGHDLYIYNVIDLAENRYLDFDEFMEFCEEHKLKRVPIIDPNFTLSGSVELLLKLADGKSILCPTANREGLVLRPLEEVQEYIGGSMQRFSFKIISNDYLLKNEQ